MHSSILTAGICAGADYSLTYSAKHSGGSTARTLTGFSALQDAWHMAAGRITLQRDHPAALAPVAQQTATRSVY